MSDTPTPDALDGLSLPELFDALAPITPPPAISMMPQTPAWAVLGLALLGGLVFAGMYVRRRHAANAYRRAGLAALSAAGSDPAAISTVLRRTALAAFPRDAVAGLHGTDWVAFLDRTAPGLGLAQSPLAEVLLAGPYAAQPPSTDLAALAKRWIETHRPLGPAEGAAS
ncbi:DUF4381 domain-containing protein [Dinoroseobacter sp. S124A]|uniref:DUF4381 domain-containing protein n=1 Tax=Dinoroseobacter sp. S124A TaxID=3415128 RepID=UPI003C79FCD7